MPHIRLQQIMGNHSIKNRASNLNAVICKNLYIILKVLSDFQNLRALKDRPYYFKDSLCLFPGFREINEIPGALLP
jgi:hypothetical protein